MQRLIVLASASSILAAALVGCQQTRPQTRVVDLPSAPSGNTIEGQAQAGAGGVESVPPPASYPDASQQPIPNQPPQVPQQTAIEPTQSNTLPPPINAPQTAPAARYPYGTRIAGRPGFVTSPHAPSQGLVDVRDPATQKPYARGTEVKCPYTGKIFLVP